MEYFSIVDWVFIIFIANFLKFIVSVGVAIAIVSFNEGPNRLTRLRRNLAVVAGVSVSNLGKNNIVVGSIANEVASIAKSEFLFYNTSFVVNVFALIVYLLFAILGGYIAGRITRQNEIVYGLAVGIGSVLSFAISYALFPQSLSDVWEFVLFALSVITGIGSATLGSYFSLLQRERNQAKFPSENAIEFIKQGRLLEAQKLLKPLIAADYHNLPAWFLLIETYPTYQQKINALEICLEQNPDDEKVKQILDKLRKSMVKGSA